MSDFHEGAWVYSPDPDKGCPDCKKMCIFSANVKKFGEHRVRVCVPCRKTYHNGEASPLEVFPEPK